MTEDTPPVDTPAQDEELRQSAVQAQRALQQNKEIAHAASAMLVARQAYYLLLSSLTRLCAEQKVPDAAMDVIIDAMAKKAMEPFDPKQLPQRLVDVLLQHVSYENSIRAAEQAKESADALEATAGARKAASIPVPFPVLSTDFSAGLPKHMPLVLAGPAEFTTLWALLVWQYVTTSAETIRSVRLRLGDSHQLFTKEEKTEIVLGRNLWEEGSTSTNKFDKFMTNWLRRFKNEQIDLLLVDDLTAFGGPYPAMTGPVNKAARGLQVLRRWCESHGCALIGGIPLRTTRSVSALAEQFPGGADALQQLLKHAIVANTFTVGESDDVLRLRLGRFEVQFNKQQVEEVTSDSHTIAPCISELLNQALAARDALASGAGVQTQRDDEGRAESSGAGGGEAEEVAGGDSEPTGFHRSIVEGLHRVPEDAVGNISIAKPGSNV